MQPNNKYIISMTDSPNLELATVTFLNNQKILYFWKLRLHMCGNFHEGSGMFDIFCVIHVQKTWLPSICPASCIEHY